MFLAGWINVVSMQPLALITGSSLAWRQAGV
jgi:hypothetical protein